MNDPITINNENDINTIYYTKYLSRNNLGKYVKILQSNAAYVITKNQYSSHDGNYSKIEFVKIDNYDTTDKFPLIHNVNSSSITAGGKSKKYQRKRSRKPRRRRGRKTRR